MIYIAAMLFALGVTYFWPTMLGCVAEYIPKSGALGMSLMGGAGMFAMSIWNPVIGSWIDTARSSAEASGASAEQIEILAGQAVLQNLLIPNCFNRRIHWVFSDVLQTHRKMCVLSK